MIARRPRLALERQINRPRDTERLQRPAMRGHLRLRGADGQIPGGLFQIMQPVAGTGLGIGRVSTINDNGTIVSPDGTERRVRWRPAPNALS